MSKRSLEILSQVSQTERMWMNGASGGRADVLLDAAPAWLEIGSADNNSPDAVFDLLAASSSQIKDLGFQGVYLGDTAEKTGIWRERSPHLPSSAGASLDFDPSFGDDDAYERFVASAEAAGLEIGSSLLASATGLGPDFFLQARAAPDAGGTYAMLPVPFELWKLLPETKNEWDCQSLPSRTVAELAANGVLPARLARDDLPWAQAGGWAVTGPVKGLDGQERRWLYRYSGHPGQAALFWQDPFGRAKKILAAGVIRQTGLQGQALIGLHMEALMGLEPGASQTSLEPGIEALNELASQAHRYGGWAMQADPLPPEFIIKILNGQCDFCRDDITEALAEYGLRSENARPLGSLYRKWLKQDIDFSRLSRGMHSGLNGRILAGLVPDPAHVSDSTRRNKATRTLISFRLGLPGLVFLTPEELGSTDGILPDLRDNEAQRLKKLLVARKQRGLASGRLIKIYENEGSALGFLTRLPDGGYWLMAINFSTSPTKFSISAPEASTSASDAETGISLSENFNSTRQKFTLALDGSQCVNVVF